MMMLCENSFFFFLRIKGISGYKSLREFTHEARLN